MLDVVMEIWAITVIAALAGAFGSFLQKRGEERGDKSSQGKQSEGKQPQAAA